MKLTMRIELMDKEDNRSAWLIEKEVEWPFPFLPRQGDDIGYPKGEQIFVNEGAEFHVFANPPRIVLYLCTYSIGCMAELIAEDDWELKHADGALEVGDPTITELHELLKNPRRRDRTEQDPA